VGSILEVLDYNMWLPVSPTKCWGEAGSILEVPDYNMWLPVSPVKC